MPTTLRSTLPVRLVRFVAAIRRLRLRVGEHTDRNHGSDVDPVDSRLALGDDNFVETRWIGEPPACHERSVHGRELAVGAAGQHCGLLSGGLVRVGGRDPVSIRRVRNLQRHDVRIEDREGTHPLDVGQVRDLGDEAPVVPGGAAAVGVEDRGHHLQILGACARQVRRERRLRTSRTRHRAHRQATEKANQDHDRGQATPSPSERRAEPVPDDPHDRRHDDAPPSAPKLTRSPTSRDPAHSPVHHESDRAGGTRKVVSPTFRDVPPPPAPPSLVERAEDTLGDSLPP